MGIQSPLQPRANRVDPGAGFLEVDANRFDLVEHGLVSAGKEPAQS
jgi:hypothetical protein